MNNVDIQLSDNELSYFLRLKELRGMTDIQLKNRIIKYLKHKG